MNTFTTLIAEDEPLAAESLADWVRELPQLDLLEVAHDGQSALVAIQRHQPALVFMDINMPGMSGLQVLRQLAQTPLATPPAVIFTTAYDEHALAAFELHAVDYLLKPFSQERFQEAVSHALGLLQNAGHRADSAPLAAMEAAAQWQDPAHDGDYLQRILVRDQGKIFPLQVEQIEYMRSDTKYTAVSCKGRQFLVRLPITSFAPRLDPVRFLKLQRSCIVNMDFVESMTPDENSQLVIQMRDGTRFTASRDVSKRLREQSL